MAYKLVYQALSPCPCFTYTYLSDTYTIPLSHITRPLLDTGLGVVCWFILVRICTKWYVLGVLFRVNSA